MSLRVGILGTGFGVEVQLPAFRMHPAFDVFAVASSTPGRAASLAETHDVPRALEDWRDLVALEELDLVSVASTTDLHGEQAVAALEAGKAVLCEKPMALDLAEAQSMRAAAREREAVACIDFLWRHRAAESEFHRRIAEGVLGRVARIDWTISWPGLPDWALPMSWNWQASRGGGMLGNVGSHWLDHLLWCFGPVTEVSAELVCHQATRRWPDGTEGEVDTEDAFDLELRFESGALGRLHFSALEHDEARSRLEAHGTEGTVVLEAESKVGSARRGEPLTLEDVPAGGLERDGAALGYYAPFLGVVDRIARRLRGEGVPELARFEDGVRVQAVMDAARRSSREGRAVGV